MKVLAFDSYISGGGFGADVVSAAADSLDRTNAIHRVGQRLTGVRNAEHVRLNDGTKRTRWKWINVATGVADDLKDELEMMGMKVLVSIDG